MNDINSKQVFVEMTAEIDKKVSDLAHKRNITFDECVEYLVRITLDNLENGSIPMSELNID